VHRQVGAPIEQGLFDLFGEQPLAAYLRQRHVGDFVAGGLDDLDAALNAQSGEARAAPIGPATARVASLGKRW
jgi:hypothetical protein